MDVSVGKRDVEATLRVLAVACACFDDMLAGEPGFEDRTTCLNVLEALRGHLVRVSARPMTLDVIVRENVGEVRQILALLDGEVTLRDLEAAAQQLQRVQRLLADGAQGPGRANELGQPRPSVGEQMASTVRAVQTAAAAISNVLNKGTDDHGGGES